MAHIRQEYGLGRIGGLSAVMRRLQFPDAIRHSRFKAMSLLSKACVGGIELTALGLEEPLGFSASCPLALISRP
jgi:hypothetical protein